MGMGGSDAFHGVPDIELAVSRDRVEAVPTALYSRLIPRDITPV
jgi:hypothetical protein